jgi:hypothetical protein
MGWTPASGPFLLCRLGALEDWVGRLSCDSRKNPRDWEHEGLHAVPFSPPEPISLIHKRVLAASNNPFLFLEKIWERNHFPLINLRPSGVSALDRPLHTSGAAEGQAELRAQSPKLSRTWAGRSLKTRAAPCLGSHPSARRKSRPWCEECHLPSSSQAELRSGRVAYDRSERREIPGSRGVLHLAGRSRKCGWHEGSRRVWHPEYVRRLTASSRAE